METERKKITLGVDKLLPGGFDIQVRLRNDGKHGASEFLLI